VGSAEEPQHGGGLGVAVVRFGGIETGGTKTVVAVGDPDRVAVAERFATGDDPDETLWRAADFLLAHGPLDAVGVASFGPCDPDPASPDYGRVTTTPKPGWAGTDVLGGLRSAGIAWPLAFDTDVNAAARAEWQAAGRRARSLLYVTVGTGIGGGAMVAGRPLHGAIHPEMGHQRIWGAPESGVCPYHGACWEGVAAGPAIAARHGVSARDLPSEHPGWQLEAALLATGLANLALVLSSDRIVLGGGIGARPDLHALVRPRLAEAIADYVPLPQLVPPALGAWSGVRGALALAATAIGEEEPR
jgi:fructokinase